MGINNQTEIKLQEGFYRGNLKNEIKEFYCNICFNIPLNPISCNECEDLFCSKCINTFLMRHNNCPSCKEVFQFRKMNKKLKNLLDSFSFKCPLNCGKSFYYKFFKNHLDSSCCKLNVKCPYCNLDFRIFSYKEHEANCLKRKNFGNCMDFCQKSKQKICQKFEKYDLLIEKIYDLPL